MKRIVFFTGAGVSKESGIATFRDSKDGLWNNFKIEDVCTPNAWYSNPDMVNEFYNMRRREVYDASPNDAHYLIAQLEKDFIVDVITQNVDDLIKYFYNINIEVFKCLTKNYFIHIKLLI